MRGFADASVASVDANPHVNYGTLDNTRSYSWQKAKGNCYNKSVRFRWLSIKPAVFAWLKLKPRVSCFTVCIATRWALCVVWSTNMPPVGLHSHPALAYHRREVITRQSGRPTTTCRG